MEFGRLVCNRMVRLWPAMLVPVFLTILLGDFPTPNFWNMSKILTFRANEDMESPSWALNTWSTAVDLHVSIGIIVVFVILKRLKLEKKVFPYLLIVLLSIVIRGFIFLQDPQKSGLIYIAGREFEGVFQDLPRQHYINARYGFEGIMTVREVDYYYDFFASIYMPAYARFGPFFVGSILAVNCFNSWKTHFTSPKSHPKPSLLLKGAVWFCRLLALLPLLPVFPPPPPGSPPPPLEVDLFFTSCYRVLVPSAWAVVIFTTVVPPSHPLYSSFTSSLLSFGWIGKMLAPATYLVYLTHGGFSIEFTYNWIVQWYGGAEKVIGNGDIVNHKLVGLMALISIPTIFTTSLILHHVFEKRMIGIGRWHVNSVFNEKGVDKKD